MKVSQRALMFESRWNIQLSVIFATFGTVTGYFVIVGDMIGPAIGQVEGFIFVTWRHWPGSELTVNMCGLKYVLAYGRCQQ